MKYWLVVARGWEGSGCGYKMATGEVIVVMDENVLCPDCTNVNILVVVYLQDVTVGGNWVKGP